MRSDFSSVHSTNYSFLKAGCFSHTFQSGILNVMFILNHPILIHSMASANVTECMLWASLPWNPCCCGRLLYFHICQLRGLGGGGWKNENSRDPNKPVQSLWYEPELSELGYFIVKYGSIIIFLSTCA